MGKYEIVEKLLYNTTEEIRSNKDNWVKFLHTASRMYKYSFDEQVLIHAQRPDAKAAATLNVWNKAMNCYVNKGASGIALIDNTTNRKLKYVFDVTDVTADKRIGKYPKLWVMQEEYKESVIKHLESIYGKTDPNFNFNDRIIELSLKIADEYTTEMLPDFKDFFLESSLTEHNENDLYWILCHTLAETISYTTLLRCGVSNEEIYPLFDFAYLEKLDSDKSFSYVGDASMKLVSPILSEIGKAVFKCEESLAKEHKQDYNALKRESDKRVQISEDDFIIGKEMDSDMWYVFDGIENKKIAFCENEAVVRDLISLMVEKNELPKEDIFYGIRIRKDRGLLFSEVTESRPAGGIVDEVRSIEEEISRGEQATQMGGLQNGRFSEGTLSGDTEGSGSEIGRDNGADGEGRERERGLESERPDPLGADDEQYPTEGGRNRIERDSLRINANENDDEADEKSSAFLVETTQDKEFYQMTLFPTQAEQIGDIAVKAASIKEEKPDIYTLPEDILPRILSSGAGTPNNKIRIYDYWQKNRFIDGFISLLKKEYGTLGKGFDVDGHSISVLFNENGLQVGYGNSAKENVLASYSWSQISLEISNMIENGDYLSADEINSIDEIEGKRIAEDISALCREVNNLDEVFTFYGKEFYTSDNIKSLLQDITSRERLYLDLMSLHSSMEAGERKLRFYGKSDVRQMIDDVVNFGQEMQEFPKKEYVKELSPAFITQDELDAFLSEGSNFTDGEYRIQEFFENHSERNLQVEFLKREYGTGSSSIAWGISGRRFGTQHDAKGLRFKSSSFMGGNIDILLSWNNVAKRIAELVEADIYLSAEKKEKYEKYKERKLQKELEKAVPNFGTQDTVEEQDKEKKSETQIADVKGTADTESELQEAWSLLDEYIRREIVPDEGLEPLADIISSDKLDKINVAVTETEPDEFLVHTYVDLVNFRINRYVEEEMLDFKQYNTLRELIDAELKTCNFEDFVYVDDELIQENKDKLYWQYERRAHGEELRKNFPKAHENYKSLLALAPQIINEEKDYMRFESEPFMPLTIEKIGSGRIAMAHHFIQNGDVMADPDMEFELDVKNECLFARTYQQDSLAYYQTAETDEGINVNLAKELDDFAKTWFKNIKSQGYEPVLEIKEDVPNFGTEQNINEEMEHSAEEIGYQPKDYELINDKPVVEVSNYKIKGVSHGFGTPKEKYRWNIDAIETLYKLEEENRPATKEEQDILAKYVGWGGLSDVFDETKSSWNTEYNELKRLLSKEEYASARASTLNAHYTSPAIIDAIYFALENFGFKKGNILEPAMGVGNFFGKLPNTMKGSRLYGVELDDVSGRIAKKLYPDANISISGFEDTKFDNAFFDVAIGNVPFGQYSVSDKKYDKHHFMIHDYFFAKSLDLVREGGVVAFITSKGTLDKQNPAVRKYIAQRAELIGAIRLPNTAFKGNAGTEVTSDIIFLKKRDRVVDIEEDWVHLGVDENGIAMNQYFVEHPEMILGSMEMVSGPYGMESTCQPDNTTSFETQLAFAVSRLSTEIDLDYEFGNSVADEENEEVISASPEVKNFTYTLHNNKVYYRENSMMYLQNFNEKETERAKGLIELRDCTYELINMQMEEYSDEDISKQQVRMNTLYDSFVKKHGSINTRANRRVFSSDSSYSLLCSLEKLNENGEVVGKADMFYKRTIKKHTVATSVDTPAEALALSLGEKAKVDMEYMALLCGKKEDDIIRDLEGIIFLNPISKKWEAADEYLSGNVREKLKLAEDYALNDSLFESNVRALKNVQPKELDASEIDVRLGATWVDTEYINEFMEYLFETPRYLINGNYIAVNYSEYTGEWNVKGKNLDNRNTLASMTYGTKRANGYRILEDTLNLRDVRIYDTVYEDGKEKRVLNRQETMLACQKQDVIKEKFKEWIYADPVRRQALCEKYNVLFNSVRPREFDGSHLTFAGMSPDIQLKPHQLNAVARQLYGGNTLLAHCVGAGKTFEICAAAMEKKRLGLCQKNLIVVPNHLTEQWASEFLSLYPGANILAATKRDFEPANRKKFCSRIATGDYDAIIIGHSQFEKVPLSVERQRKSIEAQIDEVSMALEDLVRQKGERYSIKQMERTRKSLEKRLKSLNDADKKDDVVTFEQLGVDSLFVDESHNYKNLFLYTKMRNVSGVAQTEAKKSSDMYAKCQYIDEITGGTGITFATGTPISNSMTELYTNMRYLQSGMLRKLNLSNFDAWAATFGETQTAIELAPEGTGFRTKTRFAKFYNLPELISLFKEAADVQTADMLNLPVPEAEYENVVLKPSEIQKATVKELGDRAETIRAGAVPSHIDNMLKVTNDGRKLALEQRLLDFECEDYENSKVNACVDRAFKIWESTSEQKSAQLIFCDLSTPKADGSFNVYSDLKEKLIAKGVPEKEIAFIHDANTDTQKAELFAKVRSGQVRFLVGSTSKMGAGTNVQDRLIALHHLDVPWRPSDIEQQEGRILRQGNQNEKVYIYRYVTEGTFDSYSWQLIENKQRFIGQIMTSKSPVRSCDDVDATALSYAEVKTLSTGNPYIKEKMELDMDVSKLRLMKANHNSQRYRHQDNITQHYPKRITYLKEKIEGYKRDIALYKANKADSDNFSMTIQDATYTEKKDAGAKIIELAMVEKSSGVFSKMGTYQGLELSCGFDKDSQVYVMRMKGALTHTVEMGADDLGNITRLHNAYDNMEKFLEKHENELVQVERQLEIAIEEVDKPFPQEEELMQKIERLTELNALLDMDAKEPAVIDEGEEQEELTEQEELESLHSLESSSIRESAKLRV